jgi:hypothetical protein
MKPADAFIPALHEIPAPDAVPLRISNCTASVVNVLFKELQAIFPAWRQAWPDDDTLKAAKRSWVKAFMAEGIIRIGQIRHGIEHCRTLSRPFAPSVGEFISMCRPTPDMLGLPSFDSAYLEAVINAHPGRANAAAWSHPAVYHAAAQCGFHALAALPVEASRKLFDRNYEITVRMILDGRPLRSIPLALPKGSVRPRTPEIGNQALAQLRKTRRLRGIGTV